ncbi:MAG: tRNA 2-thiouridine(34) synthase MnmA [Lachnospiraceae bacterium]|nr:tRNA 2-thiouridine(34) synthase MnmA [Lachnospiraceae bacterium]
MQTVVVGMSGGVDSSVAAYLLKEQGYQVIGVTMQIWQEEEPSCVANGCCGVSAVEDARRVAQCLEIPYYVMNFRNDFKEHVIDYFIREYHQGRTPNPCIACNRYVKWEALLERAKQIGADYIATGHYAKIKHLENGRYAIERSDHLKKDQSYALYNLTQAQLSQTLFPLGAYEKEEVRRIAASRGLPIAHKPDSQEICFVPDNDYGTFLEKQMAPKQAVLGNFVNTKGEILGVHKGIFHYTIGQRRGLGLSQKESVYVMNINPDTHEILVGTKEELQTTKVACEQLTMMSIEQFTFPATVMAKIRYNATAQKATLTKQDDDSYLCTFEEPVMGAASGQAIVFYENNCILGGAVINQKKLPCVNQYY